GHLGSLYALSCPCQSSMLFPRARLSRLCEFSSYRKQFPSRNVEKCQAAYPGPPSQGKIGWEGLRRPPAHPCGGIGHPWGGCANHLKPVYRGKAHVALTAVDRALLQRCLNHEAGAWNDFVDRFLELIYHVIHHTAHLRSAPLRPEDTEDLAAEVLLQI